MRNTLRDFNSFMVQLKDAFSIIIKGPVIYFNSFMVQLKESRRELATVLVTDFNSFMVQLKGGGLFP